MTKPWEDVRQQIVELISDGKSLKEVQAILLRDRKFDASTRSYRKMLKQWKLTRTGQFESRKSENHGVRFELDTSSVQGSEQEPGGLQIPVSETSPSGSDMASRLTPESGGTDRLAGDPSHNIGNENHARRATSRESTLQPPSAFGTPNPTVFRHFPGPVNAVDKAYQQLEAAQTGQEKHQILLDIRATLHAGVNNILHHAASKDDVLVLDCVVDFVQSNHFDIDMTSASGHTALEIAILAGNSATTDLLARAGANLERRSPHSGHPLHLAASLATSAEVCRVLLQRGAEVNAQSNEFEACNRTPLRLAVDRALDMPSGRDRDLASNVVQVLIDHGASFSNHGAEETIGEDRPIINFLYYWIQLSGKRGSAYGYRLGHFLNTGGNPLCWFPSQFCKGCSSLASFVFGHTNNELGTLLIKCSDVKKHGEAMAFLIIWPCNEGAKQASTPSASHLLDNILQRSQRKGTRPAWNRKLIYGVLERSPPDQKLLLLQTLLKYNVVQDGDLPRTLKCLSEIDQPFRLELAEALLWPDQGLIPNKLYVDIVDLFFSSKETRRAYPGDGTQESYAGFNTRLLWVLHVPPNEFKGSDAEKIAQCVVHVLTTLVSRGWLTDRPYDEQMSVLELRQTYGLAPLPISSDYVLRAMQEQQWRSVANVRRKSTGFISRTNSTTSMADYRMAKNRHGPSRSSTNDTDDIDDRRLPAIPTELGLYGL